MYQDNAAYNYSRFDIDENAVRKAEKRRENHIKLHKVSAAKSGNWFKTIVLVACAAMLAFAVINSKAVLSEMSAQISEINKELELAELENVRLQANLDTLVTLNKVEESAVNELGLHKTQQSQVRYIASSDESLSEVAPEENNVFVSISHWFDEVLEYLGF